MSTCEELEQTTTFDGGNEKTGGFITTFTGKKFNPITPTLDTISINDIATALSNMCRFGGHVTRFYSVAQHSVVVSQICDEKDELIGLLHDASEAYIGDMVRPLKYTDAMTPFREIEDNISKLIVNKFGLSYHMTTNVKDADNISGIAEAMLLFDPAPSWAVNASSIDSNYCLNYIKYQDWSPTTAKYRFLERFYELTNNKQMSLF